MIQLSSQVFSVVFESILWAFKHTHRDVSEIGLEICYTFLKNLEQCDSNIANAFYQNYLIMLLENIMLVLTDSDHKSGTPYGG